MNEPAVWMQLGISDERYRVILMEIQSILKTREPIGTMMLMVQDSQKMSDTEKQFASFAIAKEDIKRRLLARLPPSARGLLKGILDD